MKERGREFIVNRSFLEVFSVPDTEGKVKRAVKQRRGLPGRTRRRK